jgi:hypothetical protein
MTVVGSQFEALAPQAIYGLLQDRLREAAGEANSENFEAEMISSLLGATLDWLDVQRTAKLPSYRKAAPDPEATRGDLIAAMDLGWGRVPLSIRASFRKALRTLNDGNGLTPDLFKPVDKVGGDGGLPATVDEMEYRIWCWIYWRLGQEGRRRGSRNALLMEVAAKAHISVGGVDAWLREARKRNGLEEVNEQLRWFEDEGRAGSEFLYRSTLDDMCRKRFDALTHGSDNRK